jgi:hypothetical protein
MSGKELLLGILFETSDPGEGGLFEDELLVTLGLSLLLRYAGRGLGRPLGIELESELGLESLTMALEDDASL